jgi:ribosomal protein S18 acetylase RimI-like enzyme
MADQLVRVATEEQRERVLATLELAFAADPVMRWFWPDPEVYRSSFPRFVEAVGGRAFEHATAQVLDDGRAVAMWLPPRVAAEDDAIVTVLLETVDANLLPDLAAFGDRVREHHPTTPHWYLPFTGVDPYLQGGGMGTSLLRHTLSVCDRDGQPAYLEASTPRSRALYERAGFTRHGQIQAGSSPTVWPMVRHPVTRVA